MTTDVQKREDSGNERPYGCAAYGCPLDGSISHSTTGGGPWFCASHFGTRPEDRDQITAKIRANLWLIRFALRVERIDPTEWEKAKPQADAYCRQHNRPDLVLQPEETRGKYVARLIAAFSVLVAATPVHRETKPEPKKTVQGPALLEDLLSETVERGEER